MSDSYGLSSHHLNILFPFNFVIDRQFKIVQIGPSIGGKFDGEIVLNTYMDDFFELSTPASLLNWGYLRTIEHEFCSLRHKKSSIDFSAKILPSSPDTLLFLIKPLVSTEAYLEKLGLSASDFSNHDLVNDLFLQVNKSKGKKDINLNDAITAQESQLIEIRNLLESQEAESRKLAYIISRSSYWVVITDTDGNIEWSNNAFNDNSGISQDKLSHYNLNQLLDVSVEQFEEIKNTLFTKENFQKQILLNVDGNIKWIDIDIWSLRTDQDNVLNFVVICRDITVQKNAQILSNQLSQELNSIFDLSLDGFVSFDQKGNISKVNSAFLDMCGLDIDQLESICLSEFEILMSDISQTFDSTASELSNNVTIIKIIKPNDHREKVTTIRRTIKKQLDNTSGVINYFQDISHEYELSKMKGEFLSMAAHELRTPMASIYGFSDLLIKREFNQNQRKEMVENIFRQAVRMTKLINDLLDLSRLEAIGKASLTTKLIDITDLIDTALQEFKSIAGTRLIQFNTHKDTKQIHGNFDKLIQVLVNLLSNAHKYSATDKPIIIDIHLRTSDEIKYIGIHITDSGIGMSRDDLKKLFEPFFRAASVSDISGTGLGMSIVKEIIELHEGKIEVESKLTVGTQVTCWLPIA